MKTALFAVERMQLLDAALQIKSLNQYLTSCECIIPMVRFSLRNLLIFSSESFTAPISALAIHGKMICCRINSHERYKIFVMIATQFIP